MTPAIELAKKLNIDYQLHDYSHDSQATSYGLEAAEKLGVAAEQVYKTLVVQTETNKLAVAIVPVNSTVNLKKMAKAIGCKKVQMADPKQVERSTGYVLGGVSPLGQKKRLVTVIEYLAQQQPTIYVSAGRRGLELELTAQQLAETLDARFVDIADITDK
ncbi:Cys-tRNA(Pro) deacylase [Psychrobacter urativorans]|uniref:Cys-tRNA(Pro) deacylase n=1 Tax=Psychrobacter urativorans TaxID=45610 RepID=UPI003BB64B3C